MQFYFNRNEFCVETYFLNANREFNMEYFEMKIVNGERVINRIGDMSTHFSISRANKTKCHSDAKYICPPLLHTKMSMREEKVGLSLSDDVKYVLMHFASNRFNLAPFTINIYYQMWGKRLRFNNLNFSWKDKINTKRKRWRVFCNRTCFEDEERSIFFSTHVTVFITIFIFRFRRSNK